VYDTVWDAVAEFPQLSVTIQDFVVEKAHPDPVSCPTVPVAIRPTLQLSVTKAVPNAAAIWAAFGLHPRVPAAAREMTGAWVSLL